MINSLLITTLLLLNFYNLSAQERYSVSDNIEISELSDLLGWDESKVEYKSTPSVDTTQTSSCIYYHKNEILEVSLVEENEIIYSLKDENYLKIADGSFNEMTGEITYEYYQSNGYYEITILYKTTKSYKGIKELINEIAGLIELNQIVYDIPSRFIIGN